MGSKGKLAEAFASLLLGLWKQKQPTHNPRSLRSQLARCAPHLCEGYQQHDAQEFIAFCIDGLHEAIMRPGRIDLKLKFDKASTTSLKRIVRQVYGLDTSTPCAALDAVGDDDERYHRKWSPAEIQEQCLQEPSVAAAMALFEQEVVS